MLLFSAMATLLACAGEEATSQLATKPSPRLSGPVSLSLQNEINAAVDRGRDWLISQQNADGSFGTNSGNRIENTSVATLALLHNATSNELAAAIKAGNWLAKNTCSVLEVESWRKLALLTAWVTAVTGKPANSNLVSNAETWRKQMLQVLPHLPQSSIGPDPLCDLLLNIMGHSSAPTNSVPDNLLFECLKTATHMPVTPTATNVLIRLASSWPISLNETNRQYSWSFQDWIFARFINRAGGGTLADAQGKIVDWRNDLAQKIVDSQTSANGGKGGFWQDAEAKSWTGQPIAATAFALLALDEL